MMIVTMLDSVGLRFVRVDACHGTIDKLITFNLVDGGCTISSKIRGFFIVFIRQLSSTLERASLGGQKRNVGILAFIASASLE